MSVPEPPPPIVPEPDPVPAPPVPAGADIQWPPVVRIPRPPRGAVAPIAPPATRVPAWLDGRPGRVRRQYVAPTFAGFPAQSADPMQPNYVPPPSYPGPPPGWRPEPNPYLRRAIEGDEGGPVPPYLLGVKRRREQGRTFEGAAEASAQQDEQEEAEKRQRQHAEGLNRVDWHKYA